MHLCCLNLTAEKSEENLALRSPAQSQTLTTGSVCLSPGYNCENINKYSSFLGVTFEIPVFQEAVLKNCCAHLCIVAWCILLHYPLILQFLHSNERSKHFILEYPLPAPLYSLSLNL